MTDEPVMLEPDPLSIMALFERTVKVTGFGCNPTLAYADLADDEGGTWRLGITRVTLEDGSEDWSFGVTKVG